MECLWHKLKMTSQRYVIGVVIIVLKGVLSSHKSVTGILPNNPTMLPPFSVFINFHPKLSDSCSGLIIRLEWSLEQSTIPILQTIRSSDLVP